MTHGDAAPADIVELGTLARRTLAAAARARVLAVFERSCYLDAGARGLVCLGGPDLGSGPLHALFASCAQSRAVLARVRTGDEARARASGLAIGADVVVRFAGATLWQPPAAAIPFDRPRVAGNLAELRALVEPRLPREGLGFLIAGHIPASPGIGAAAVAAAQALRNWLRDDDAGTTSLPRDGLAGLIGLGPGLTPSGDDFIGGALIALHALGEAPRARLLAGALLPRARTGTSRISFAHLDAAAQGQGSAALHALLVALLGKSDTTALASGLDAVARLGHTSGYDALAGAVVAISAKAG